MLCCFGSATKEAVYRAGPDATGNRPEGKDAFSMLKMEAEGTSVRGGRTTANKLALASNPSVHKLPKGELDRSVREGAAYLLGAGAGLGSSRTGSGILNAEHSVRGRRHSSMHGGLFAGSNHALAMAAAADTSRSVRSGSLYDRVGSADYAAAVPPASPGQAGARSSRTSHTGGVAASAASISIQRLAAAYSLGSMAGRDGVAGQPLSSSLQQHHGMGSPYGSSNALLSTSPPATPTLGSYSQPPTPSAVGTGGRPGSSSSAGVGSRPMTGGAPKAGSRLSPLNHHSGSCDDTAWSSMPFSALALSHCSSNRTSPTSDFATPITPTGGAKITGYGAINTASTAAPAPTTLAATQPIPSPAAGSMTLGAGGAPPPLAAAAARRRSSAVPEDPGRTSPSVRGWNAGSPAPCMDTPSSTANSPGLLPLPGLPGPHTEQAPIAEDDSGDRDSEPLFLLALQPTPRTTDMGAAAAEKGSASPQMQPVLQQAAQQACPDAVCAMPLVRSGTPQSVSQPNIVELESAAIAYEVAAMMGDLASGPDGGRHSPALSNYCLATTSASAPSHSSRQSPATPVAAAAAGACCSTHSTAPVSIPERHSHAADQHVRGSAFDRTSPGDPCGDEARTTLPSSIRLGSLGFGSGSALPISARRLSSLAVGSPPKAALSSSLGQRLTGALGGGSAHCGSHFFSLRGSGSVGRSVGSKSKNASVSGGTAFYTPTTQITGFAARQASGAGGPLAAPACSDRPSVTGRCGTGNLPCTVADSPFSHTAAMLGAAPAGAMAPYPIAAVDSMGRIRDESEVVALGFFARSQSGMSTGGHSSNNSAGSGSGQRAMARKASYQHMASALEDVPECRSGISDLTSSDSC